VAHLLSAAIVARARAAGIGVHPDSGRGFPGSEDRVRRRSSSVDESVRCGASPPHGELPSHPRIAAPRRLKVDVAACIAGPLGSFEGFSNLSTSVMIVLMWIGRLELIPVLVLLTRSYWRL
jgi:hypothetical protein